MASGISSNSINPNQAAINARYNEVYNHEKAHQSAAGSLGGSIVIDTDANGWATGGHVDIKMPGLDNDNPEKTKQQAQQVVTAAMAPSDPSGQDYNVAAQAKSLIDKAQAAIETKDSQKGHLDIYA